MRPAYEDYRFVFSDSKAALTAVEVLVGAGIRSSRLSIHLWGQDFAVHARDHVGQDLVDQLARLGGTLHVVPLVPPAAPTQATRRIRDNPAQYRSFSIGSSR